MNRTINNALEIAKDPLQTVPQARSWVDIDKAALHHNLGVAHSLAPHAGIIAVLKANAYGHGITGVASAISDHVSYFGVASLEEALQLESAVATVPIILLSAALSFEYKKIAEHHFIPTLSSLEEAQAFASVASPGASVNLKIDTGMGRLGMTYETAEKMVADIIKLPLTIQSISTHLHSADTNVRLSRAQLISFQKIVASLRQYAPQARVHVLNSAGVLRFPEEAYDLVRIGLSLYGIAPDPSFQKLLHPVMSWRTVVSFIHPVAKGEGVSYGQTYKAPRDLKVAVLPVGYADGYQRQLSNKGVYVLINGYRCPVLGRVTMDEIIVDISRAGNVVVGSDVVLLGKQGNQEITVTWLASKADTIPWHIFTGIGARVHRYYH